MKNMEPTKKQLNFIKVIENYLYPYYYCDDDILFKGKTKEDARKWISENYEDFLKIQMGTETMNEIYHSEHGFW